MTTSRRSFLQSATLAAVHSIPPRGNSAETRRPNILFVISDDQSYVHSAAYGCRGLNTPHSDRIATEGVRFQNAFSPAAMCTASRAALLAGRNIWQNREAGTHWSHFPRNLKVYPDLLEQAGYRVGYTGKGWGPGEWKPSGWPRNPAGPEYNRIKVKQKPSTGISDVDYAANFSAFLKLRQPGQPFCFWFGASEAHEPHEKGAALRAGKKLEDLTVPPNFPKDTPEVRHWLLDYLFELEWLDQHLGRMLETLETAGELDNTLVVVTGDNGSPMTRAKGNLYDLGTHVPLVMSWRGRIKPGRVVEDLVSFIDLGPTFLDLASLKPEPAMTGRSLRALLLSDASGRIDPTRQYVLTGHERAGHQRFDNLGYPMRAIRNYQHLYVWNMKPERSPIGDLDRDQERRPPEELYDAKTDPACWKNLATDASHESVRKNLRAELERRLREQGDPRVLGYGDIWDSYPRYGPFNPQLGGFNKRGAYNPKYQAAPK